MLRPGAFFVLALLSGVESKANSPFREGVEYRYDYEAVATTGVMEPEGHGAVFGINAKLFVQISQDTAQIKLKDVSISEYNGKIGWDAYPKMTFVDSSSMNQQLSKPFFVAYEGTKVATFATDSKDTLFTKNFKKALAGLLQFSEFSTGTEAVDVLEDAELSHYGTCPITTTVRNNGDGITLEKQRNLELCSLFPARLRTSMRGIRCGASKSELLDKSSAVTYKISVNRGHPEIQSVRAFGTINLAPFSDSGLRHFHFVNQTLVLKKTSRVNTPIEPLAATNFLPDLRYQFANTKIDLQAAENFYYSGEDYGIDFQEQFRQKLLADLLEVVDTIYDPSKEERLGDRYGVSHLLSLINRLDYQNLVTFYKQDLPSPVIDKLSSARTLFLDAVAMSGSNPGALLIRDLIKDAQLDELLATRLIATMPVYIRRSSIALVSEFEKLIGLPLAKEMKYSVVEEALLLAIPTLINKACTNQIQEYVECSPELVQKWAGYFVKQYRENDKYQKKLTAIYGLRNLGVYLSPEISGFVKRIALGKEESEGPLRSHAMVILQEAILFDPTVAPLLLSIFRNKAEPTAVRIAAAGSLLSGTAPVKYLRIVGTSLWTETNPDVLNYVRSALNSVKESKHPCLKDSADFIRELSRSLPSVPESHRRSNSYIYDFTHPSNEYGSLLQLHSVSNPKDQLPLTVAGIMNYYWKDYTFDAFRFSVHLAGARGLMPDMAALLFSGKNDDLKTDKLKTLLEEIVKLQPADRPHIEVMFTFQGHTAMAYKFDEEKYDRIVNSKDVEAFLQEFKLNYQIWQSAASAVYSVPSDIGMPVAATFDLSGLFSTRLDLTKPKAAGKLARKLNFQLVSTFDVNHAIVSYFEGSRGFHSVRHEGRAVLHLPLDLEVAIDIRKQEFDFKYTTPQASGAVELASDSMTFVEMSLNPDGKGGEEGLALLKKTCGKGCLPSIVVGAVKRSDWKNVINLNSTLLGFEARAQIKDCDDTAGSLMSNLAKELINPIGINFRGNFLAGLYLWVDRARHMMLLRSDGKLCAQRARLHRSAVLPTTQIAGRLRVRLPSDDSNPSGSVLESGKTLIRMELNWKGEKKESDRKTDFDIVYEYNNSGAKQLINIRVKIDASPAHKIGDYMLCLKAEGQYPSGPYDQLEVDSVKSVPEARMNVDFAIGKVASLASAQCPTDQFRFKFTVAASSANDVLDLKKEAKRWPYDQCKKDKESGIWPKHVTPQTDACRARAIDFTTMRSFYADAKLIEVPESVEMILERTKNIIITALLPYWSTEKAGKPTTVENIYQFSTDFEITREDKVNIVINQAGVNNKFSEISLPKSLILPSSRFSYALMTAFNTKTIASCTITPNSVATLDGSNINATIHTCPTLITADCSESTSYAVFLKRNDDQVPLSLIAYLGNDRVEITPDGAVGKFTVKVNGGNIDTSVPGGVNYPQPSDKSSSSFRIRYSSPFFTIVSPKVGIYIQFSGYHASIYPSPTSAGRTCGLCGNYDMDPANDLKSPSNCEVPQENHVEQFVLGSECQGQTFEKVEC